MTDRATFIKRIRNALGPEPAAPLPPVDGTLLRQVAPDDPACMERWVTMARSNSITVKRVTRDGVLAAIDECLAQHATDLVLQNAHALEEQFELSSHWPNVICWGEPGCRERAFSASVAVTDCRYALADNGAILVWSDLTFGRSSTLTVPVHVVLVPASRILPDLTDAFARIRTDVADLPSNIVLITGPSKTADIEMNLVTGVHGPKWLYAVLIEDQYS